MASRKKKRTAIVPRAVFAAVVTLGSVPSLAACHGDPAPTESQRRAAELRPVTPPSAPPPPPEPTPPATLEPLEPVDAGIDAGPDAGIDAGRRAHRARPHPLPPGVAVRPPPYLGVAAHPFAVAAPYGVAARPFKR